MIHPIGDYVLVEVEKQEEQTVGGIILPEMKKDKLQTGTLVEGMYVNESPNLAAMLSPGVKIWFKMWSGEPVEYFKDDKRVRFGKVKMNYLLINRKDIIAYEGE